MQAPPEQLGSFYLGVEYDLKTGQRLEQPITYDARDLTTHAVCVGMTGSGKTGLCIGLLEEAALDKVPTILIDPKGDITNLLLQFPELHPDDFIPWINPDDARRKGQTEAEYAQATAERMSPRPLATPARSGFLARPPSRTVILSAAKNLRAQSRFGDSSPRSGFGVWTKSGFAQQVVVKPDFDHNRLCASPVLSNLKSE